MTTTQLLIVCLAVVLIAVVAAVTKWRVRMDELAAELAAVEDRREERREMEQAAKERAQPSGLGPPDGTQLAVYVGAHLVRGNRVQRNDPDAADWIVLEDAELIDGPRATPLGGRAWLRRQWLQELS
jgi:hypothetical protein